MSDNLKNPIPKHLKGKLGFDKIINPLLHDYIKENTSLIGSTDEVHNEQENNEDFLEDVDQKNFNEEFENNGADDEDNFDDEFDFGGDGNDANGDANGANGIEKDYEAPREQKSPKDPKRERNVGLNNDEYEFEEPWANEEDGEEEDEKMTPELIRKKKLEYIAKLERIKTINGLKPYKLFTLSDDLSDIQNEHERLRKQIDMEKGVNMCKTGTVAVVTIIEVLNTIYDPFDLKLKGWSETLKSQLEDHDDVFIELYEKYGSYIDPPPEIKLIGIIFFSGLSFHYSSSMMDNMAKTSPDHYTIISQNPELKRLFDIEVEKTRLNEMNKTKSGNFLSTMFDKIGITKSKVKPTSPKQNTSLNQNSNPINQKISKDVENFQSSKPLDISPPDDVDDILKMFDDDKQSTMKTLEPDVESKIQKKSGIRKIKL